MRNTLFMGLRPRGERMSTPKTVSEAISDLEIIEKNLDKALQDLDAMGIHLSVDKSPVTSFLNHLVMLEGYYEERAGGI